MRNRPKSLLRQVNLPANPPTILDRPLLASEVPGAIREVYKLFGIDPDFPTADRRLVEAMARVLFPKLGSPLEAPPRPGRPREVSRKDPIARLVAMASAYDAFVSGLTLNEARLYARFRSEHSELAPLFMIRRGRGDATPIALQTFHKKLQIGRSNQGQHMMDLPPAFYRLPARSRGVYEALFYADHHPLRLANPSIRRYGSVRGDLLQMELLRLRPRSAHGRQRLREIEAEARLIVPERIDFGMVSLRPFYRIDM